MHFEVSLNLISSLLMNFCPELETASVPEQWFANPSFGCPPSALWTTQMRALSAECFMSSASILPPLLMRHTLSPSSSQLWIKGQPFPPWGDQTIQNNGATGFDLFCKPAPPIWESKHLICPLLPRTNAPPHHISYVQNAAMLSSTNISSCTRNLN